MLLTCPKCQSGLQVPDGTTALVRCPACKTVFSPVESAAPDEDEEDEPEQPKAKKRKPAQKADDDEDDSPRKKPTRAKGNDAKEKEPKSENRDFDPETEEEEKKRKKKRKKSDDDSLSPEEKAKRRAAFERAAWGCKLIWISFALFMLSMALIIVFFFQFAFAKMMTPSLVYLTIAGVLGVLNWTLAAVGVGLCLSGPQSPGHWRYGISAAIATGLHLILLLVVVGQNTDVAIGRGTDAESSAERWGMIPTRLDTTMYYLTVLVYHQQEGFTPKGRMVLSMITGVVEMVRTVCIMMLLSCMARAALDEELAHTCTRAAGIASFGPGLVALLMFFFVVAVVETSAGLNLFTLILFVTVNMGVYSILSGVIFPCLMAARAVTDACEEPFQSLIPKL